MRKARIRKRIRTNDTRLTRHHIIPVSRGGSDKNENIIVCSQTRHRAYHLLFGNALPAEAIEIFINEWTKERPDERSDT